MLQSLRYATRISANVPNAKKKMRVQIEVAAKWWSDQLRTRTKQDNGDNGMAAMLMLMVSLQEPSHADKAGVFEAHLIELLDVRLKDQTSCILSTDYAPGGLLNSAAMKAGVPAHCPPFPMKTVMWIEADKVSVKHGYGAKEKVLWGAPAIAIEAESPQAEGEDL
jgi:hypothetical protein